VFYQGLKTSLAKVQSKYAQMKSTGSAEVKTALKKEKSAEARAETAEKAFASSS
jgi:hypothetical protein